MSASCSPAITHIKPALKPDCCGMWVQSTRALSSFPVRDRTDGALAPCGPAAPQDQECWELRGIPGLAGKECDSPRGTGTAPAQDILGTSPEEDGGGQGKAGIRAGGSGQGRAVGSCSPALVGVAGARIGGSGRLPWGPGPWTALEDWERVGKTGGVPSGRLGR